MLITLPAPSGTERKVEVVDVELVPAAQLEPKIELDVDQTATLPSSPDPQTAGAETVAPEPVAESPQAAPESQGRLLRSPDEESAIEPAGEPLRSQQKPRRSPQMSPLSSPTRSPMSNRRPLRPPLRSRRESQPSGPWNPSPLPRPSSKPSLRVKRRCRNLQQSRSPRREKPRRKERGLRQRPPSQLPKSCRRHVKAEAEASVSPDLAGCGEEGACSVQGLMEPAFGRAHAGPAKR